MTEVREFAGAKVNLALHVTGQRANGYHTLDSLVVHCADVADGLVVEPGDGFSLAVDGPFGGGLGGANDLVARAASAWSEATGRAADVSVKLTKNLPVASGIGGGSSDAAATLRALRTMRGVPVGHNDLFAVARSLGADCPMCLDPRPAFARGIGDELTPAELPPLHLVLANPGVALSTPAVFAARQGDFGNPLPPLPSPSALSDFAAWLAEAGNDLEAAAVRLEPSIKGVLAALGDCALHAGMSGSGATCYGLFGERNDADAAATSLQKTHPDWWVRAATTNGAPT
ncbi:4-(cytidine 5'-diphospho)-2-C-methyl-D-erythritol kinase [Rhizobiaceae bacterium]|nr:4-(cytidine 5'-diphospho)-2-C-methyl-D-erythritol kinase [Rhizobiaceae bacterium]